MKLHGIALRFATAQQLTEATRALVAAGYRDMEAYSPFPVEEVEEILKRKSRLPLIALIAAVLGGIGGLYLQTYIAMTLYPMNVGGRPLFSWPAFVPITFEMTILSAGVSIFLGFFFLTRLPEPRHPIFSIPSSERITDDQFVLCLEASDPLFAKPGAREFLNQVARAQNALEVSDVPL